MIAWLWLWAPVAAQMAAIFVASSQPTLPDLPAGLSNYTGHVIAYFVLSVLAVRAFSSATWRGVTRSAAVKAVALSAVYGATDEMHQLLVPNRMAGIEDWIADVAGAIIGAIVVLALRRAVAARRGV